MDEFENDLATAAGALDQLINDTGLAGAEALEKAFARTGQSIAQALSEAARTGELDFRHMAATILADLAEIATRAALGNQGSNQAGQTVNLNMSLGAGSDAGSVVGAAGNIARAVAAAAARGGRFL